MGQNIRITIKTVVEFDPNALPPEAYEPGATLTDKLQVEIDAASADPALYSDLGDAVTTIKGELVDA